MITDSVILKRLNADNKLDDLELNLRIEEKLNEPRKLDKAPGTFKLHHVKDLEVCGVKTEYRTFYNSVFDPSKINEDSTLDLTFANKGIIPCDYTVWAILKSLLLLGVTKNLKQAEACRDIFMLILLSNETRVEKTDVYRVIMTTDKYKEYYHTQIGEAIFENSFSDEEVVKAHIHYLLIDKLAPKDIYDWAYNESKATTVKEFDDWVKKNSKRHRSLGDALISMHYDATVGDADV